MSAQEHVEFRALRWWDLPAVAELERRLFAPEPWTLTQFWAELARVPQSRYYLVAITGEQVVGYAGLFAAGDTADVQTIAVAPQAQGRGIARELLAALISESERRGAQRLQLEVRSDNTRAIDLYRRAGFEADGERRDYYGPGQPGTLMSLVLSTGGGV